VEQHREDERLVHCLLGLTGDILPLEKALLQASEHPVGLADTERHVLVVLAVGGQQTAEVRCRGLDVVDRPTIRI
jgi:hypothetical protein